MFTQDWMMRQIETLTLAIAKIVFRKDTAEYHPSAAGEDGILSNADRLHMTLNAALKEGRISEGEDLLFDALEDGDRNCLEVALDFYFRLNELSDQELAAGNFSRQEIQDGLNDVMEQFGIVLP